MSVASPAAPARDRLVVGLALLALYLIWGSTYLGIRVAVETMPPFLMVGGSRFLVAGGLLYLLARARGQPHPTRREWWAAARVGALLVGGGNGLVTLAQSLGVGSGIAAAAIAVMPLWAALWSGLFGRWPVRGEWAGLGLGLAGVVLLNADGDLRANPAGALALLAAPMCWSFGSVWGGRLPLPSGAMGSATTMLTGGALLAVVGLLVGERVSRPPSAASWLAWGYLVVFGSLVGYSAYLYLLARVRPTLATSYAYVNPVVALALGVGLGGERPGVLALAALPLILGGVGLVMLARERR